MSKANELLKLSEEDTPAPDSPEVDDPELKGFEGEDDYLYGVFVDSLEDYHGFGLQVMSKGEDDRAEGEEEDFVVQVHNLQHPSADMGDGLEYVTSKHASAGEAEVEAKKWVDAHIRKKFGK